MTLILNGTDNSATTPAVTGTDTDTGVYYPAANQVALATGGTQAMLANASQGVQFANAIGVGATTPTTSGAGITFPATQSASTNANTLDDYEEGTWTPTVLNGGVTLSTISSASYTKTGRMVFIQFDVVVGSNSNGAAFVISSLPFALNSNLFSSISVGYNTTGPAALSVTGSTGLEFYITTAATAIANSQFSGTRLIVSGYYPST
jgi:hypothetical protein